MTDSSPIAGPKKRFWRYGLRSVFILITVVACIAAWVGSQMRRCRQEEDAAAHLLSVKDGRSITLLFANPFAEFPEDSPEPGIPEPFFRGGPAWLAKFLGVDIFRARVSFACAPPGNMFTWDRDDAGRLRYFYSFKTGLKDSDMVWVNKLHYLRWLQLEANEISDSGLSQLDNLPYVERLMLGNTAITDAGMSSLLRFPRLRYLSLHATNLTDAAVPILVRLRKLEKLDVGMTNISSEGLQTLRRNLPECRFAE